MRSAANLVIATYHEASLNLPNPQRPYPSAPSRVAPTETSVAAVVSDDIERPLILGTPALCDDILEGAQAIAAFMFGDAPSGKRQVYRLATEVVVPFRLPTFKLDNNTLCARKTSILKWIEQQELARTMVQDEATADL